MAANPIDLGQRVKPRSHRGPPAVYRQHRASDIRRFVGSEKERGRGNLAGLANPAQESLAELALVQLGAWSGRDAGRDRAGAESVAANIVRTVIASDAAREANQPVL